LFSPFSFSAPLDEESLEDLVVVVADLLQELPAPDTRVLQSVAKLDRETVDVRYALSTLIDSLQVGKQTATSASRLLRATQTMVVELRRERQAAEEARFWIEQDDWDHRIAERWCATSCKDIVGGFETVCDGLRKSIEESAAA